jgi:hypothetical protein
LVLRPAILDRHILAVDVPDFAEALPERRHETSSIGRRRAAEEPNNGHRRLRVRRERPSDRRAAEERDELASSHVGHRLAPLCTLTTARAANLPHVQPGAEVNWFTQRRQTLTKNY